MSLEQQDKQELVEGYLHGLLSYQEKEYVEKQLAESDEWQQALSEAQRRLEALKSLPAREASEQLIQQTLEHVEHHRERSRQFGMRLLRRSMFTAAAAIFLIAVANAYYYNYEASPYDIQVYGQRELLAGAEGAMRLRLVNRETGEPLAGVPVTVALLRQGESTTLAEFKTDARGQADPGFTLPDWQTGDYELRISARTPGGLEELTRPIKLKRSWQVMLSTDKPVYQPGQTILVRSLALRKPDLKPLAKQEATFSVTDPKGNMIFKQRVSTSKFGLSWIECPLATEINEGPYRIDCQVGDTVSSQTVKVEKYVLPKFKIDLTLDKPFYQPGQTVEGTVEAQYFFGRPVGEGQVRIVARTRDVASSVFAELEAKTNAEGKASFAFTLPETLVGRNPNGDARVWVDAIVTDTAEQQQAKTVDRLVTLRPLRVQLIPEGGRLVQGVENQIFVITSYADGRPAPASVKLQTPDRDLVAAVETNSLGVGSVNWTPEVARATVKATVRDQEGLTVSKDIALATGGIRQDFLVRTDKAVYHGGETLTLTALGGTEPLFVDFIKDGQTLLTTLVELKDGRGSYQLDLPPELFGTIEICAYRFEQEALPVRKTRIIYVHQASELAIEADLDRETYRPGEAATLQLRVTDEEGKPVVGALSLAAVDEAVFAVLDQKPGMEQTFFTLERELLEPVYAIYAWAPGRLTAPEEQRAPFEQALFARTAQVLNQPQNSQEARLGRRTTSPWEAEMTMEPDMAAMDDEGGSESAANVVVAGNGPHTLAVNSYPRKVFDAESFRRSGLAGVVVAWAVCIFGIVVMGLVCLGYYFPKTAIGLGLTMLLVPMCLLWGWGVMTPIAGSLNEARTMAGWAEAAGAETDMPGTTLESGDESAVPRVRHYFPETLLWRPQIITGEDGTASVPIDLADSITTWRLTASAVSADGRLGGLQSEIPVFQPFFVDLNLPVALTRGDEVSVPVVVYNYLDEPQDVSLTLQEEEWFGLLEGGVKQVALAAGEVKSVYFTLKVKQVGHQTLQVTAQGKDAGDAIRREIEIVPDGRRVDEVVSGSLDYPAEVVLNVPADAIEGSVKGVVKLYPSTFSQLVEGLDGIFQRPYGCFEQTSSTTYPNVLALSYLRQTQQNAPQVEAKARQYIHLGYQRLLGFEVSGGGFDWFGTPPAKRTLTAYGLMEFEDMSRVINVDPNLILRTRGWLMSQQKRDGSWDPDKLLHDDPTLQGEGEDLARLSTTAYIAWAVYGNASNNASGVMTREYLLRFPAAEMQNPYLVALVANALIAVDAGEEDIAKYLSRLEELKQVSDNRKQIWWEQPQGSRTAFYGSGHSGSVEATALAVLAHLSADRNTATVRGALNWLVAQKDARGTWHSTQATVLALKALLAGTESPLGEETTRTIELAVGPSTRQIEITPDQAEVMQLLEISENLKPGANVVKLNETSETGTGFQVAFRYHVPGDPVETGHEPLSIEIQYDRTDLRVNDSIAATARVVNHLAEVAPMVILDLPIPPGFVIDRDGLEQLVEQGKIAKFQVNPRSAVVYLRGLAPQQPLSLSYRLQATMPVKVQVPAAQAYQYYDPDKRGQSAPAAVTVSAQ